MTLICIYFVAHSYYIKYYMFQKYTNNPFVSPVVHKTHTKRKKLAVLQLNYLLFCMST